jgi:AraC-like DNA-binding protein
VGVAECFWRRERWQPPCHDLGVLPDGRIDLAWGENGDVRVMGPQQCALGRPFPADVIVVGVRFAPGVGPALLGVPGHELADRHASLAALDSGAAATIMRDLTTIENPADAPAAITRAIEKRILSCGSPDPLVARASGLLARPGARVERVARELALSRRHLERRFLDLVGFGPKTLQRILSGLARKFAHVFGCGGSGGEGCRSGVGLGEELVQVLAGELPLERRGELLVAAAEGE